MKTETRIDLGAIGWRCADVEGITFGSKERAEAYAKEHGAVNPMAVQFDTRPTIKAVAELLRGSEGAEDTRWGTAGPWDEYFSVHVGAPGEKWPTDYRWIAVFVVVGGSEGLYLHVESIDCDGTRRLIIIGKTCSSGRETWDRCYESAGRISWLLNN